MSIITFYANSSITNVIWLSTKFEEKYVSFITNTTLLWNFYNLFIIGIIVLLLLSLSPGVRLSWLLSSFLHFFSLSSLLSLGSLQLLYLSLIKQNAKKEKIEKDLLPKICTLAFVSALRNGFVRL